MNFIKQLFCRHKYEPVEGLRGFLGITECVKCGKYSNLPEEEMEYTSFSLLDIEIK